MKRDELRSCPEGHKFKKSQVVYANEGNSFKCPISGDWWSLDSLGRWLKNDRIWSKPTGRTPPSLPPPQRTGIA